jgi:hypothetical protein
MARINIGEEIKNPLEDPLHTQTHQLLFPVKQG